MLSAGQLDRQITIQKKSVTQDPTYGTEIIAWVPLAVTEDSPPVAVRFNAQFQDVLPSRSESVAQGLAMARNQTRVRMRYRDDIDSTMRILLHGDGEDIVYQIIGGPAAIQGRKQFLEMIVERYSTDGAA